FEAQAARTPEAVAVVFEAESLSYGALNARANRLAHHLRGLGVGPEVRVAVCVERSLEMVVGLLGILKAGGAYVPLDPAYPAERLAYMLADSGAPVLLTQEELRGALPVPEGMRVLTVAEAGSGSGENRESGATARSLAYLIYTSGSTGVPKGVAIEHESAVALLSWAAGVYSAEELSGVLASTSISFDLSVFELFLPLSRGGRVIVVENALAVADSPAAGEVRLINTVPSAIAALLKSGRIPAGVTTVNLAGEPLKAELVDALYARGGIERVYDLYGPSEDTTYSTYTLREAGGAATIGSAISNTQAYVADRGLQAVPVGVPGELYLGGSGLARGYLGRADLTGERFVPDPFGGKAGGRLYRTGDRARWRTDGRLEYLGRLDAQVKVRGFRIELGEVEAALRRAPGVAECVVVAREDEPGERRLVAYVVGGAEAEELRVHLRRSLPEYMVPGAFVGLERLPLTPNGKLDRKALPAPEYGGAGEAYVAPRTEVEEVLAGIWAEVLGAERVGVGENFFDLGGHSLLATRVVARAQAALGTEIPLRALFEAPTVAGLAGRVEAALREGAGVQAPPIVPVPRDGSPLPLSFAQARLWFIDRLEPGSAAYNMAFPLRLRGALDARALAGALTGLARRHESLRTVFAAEDGEPVQVVLPAAPVPLPLVDLGALPKGAREAEARRLAAEDAARPFDLARGPLLRTTLVRAGEGEHALLVCLHHVVSDGWSMGVFFRELSALYAGSRLPELPVQYADYADWQRAWLSDDVLRAQLGYWRERLAGMPPLLELPTDRPRPAVAGDRGGVVGLALSPGATQALRALARREGATLFTVLLAGFQALLSRYTGSADVPVGTAVAGRDRLETEGLIGFFVNTLVIRAELAAGTTGRALVAQARERVLEAHAHQDLPFERLVEELRVERTRAHAPLFQAMFTFDAAGGGEGARLGGVEVEALGARSGREKFDLTLGMGFDGERLAGGISYRAELWEGATIERMAGHLAALLEGLAREPERRVPELPLLDDAERARVLEEWNATEREQPAGVCVHDLFAAQARRTPDAVAVSWRGEATTYAELDRRSGRLVHALRRLGVGPETRVGVCLERTPELVVALLGVLRAGGAYVPLDPAYPRERLGYMVEDAQVSLVLTSGALTGVLPGGVRPLVLADAAAGEPDVVPESGVLPDNLSHVIFTSGSTGRPKGVMIRHSSTVVLLHWLRENVSDEERSSVLFSTSINFDVSVAEIFGTLCWGGKLVLVENALELATVEEPVV
ncbi:MAG TPA: amino acid adenylation domain-containing protein, partial [Longimicrobiaceae bacterium]